MKYSVLWTAYAETNLVRLWVDSTNRNALSESVAKIDRELGNGPLSIGESRDPGERILFELPLAVKYRVAESDRKVLVFAIWLVPRQDHHSQ